MVLKEVGCQGAWLWSPGLQHLTTFVAQCMGKELGMLEGHGAALLLPRGSCPAQCCLPLPCSAREGCVVLKGGARAPGCVFCFVI